MPSVWRKTDVATYLKSNPVGRTSTLHIKSKTFTNIIKLKKGRTAFAKLILFLKTDFYNCHDLSVNNNLNNTIKSYVCELK